MTTKEEKHFHMIFLPGQMVCLDFVTEQRQASDWSRHPEKEAAATTSPLQAEAKEIFNDVM